MPRKFHDPKYADGDWATGISSAGSTQATATTLPSNWNWIETVSADTTGVVLKAMTPGEKFGVTNGTATSCVLYPPSGANFNGGTTNVGATVGTRNGVWGICISSTKYALFGV